MSDDRPSRYIETAADGTETVVYRASSIGGCIRAMVAAARGHQPRPHQAWFQDVLDEGTRMEDEILSQFQQMAGFDITDTQPEVELVVGVIDGRRVIIRGHMDGIGVERGTDLRWVVEAKKFRASTYPKFVAEGVWCSEYYPWQVSIYMHATELPCKFVAGEYVPGLADAPESISHVEWHSYVIPPVALLTIKAKVAKVERLINEGFGADEVECSGNYPCPFWYLHDEKQPPMELPASEQLAALISNWTWVAEELKGLNAKVKTLDATKKALAEELRGVIAGQGIAATAAEKFVAVVGDDKFNIAWTRSRVPEKVTKGYDLDYFTVKPVTRKKDQA